jgi:hypothetical protein
VKKIGKIKRGSRIEVRWIDSFHPVYTWRDECDIKKKDRVNIRSTGYFFHTAKHHLILSREKAKGQRCGVFYIPIGCIRSVRKF